MSVSESRGLLLVCGSMAMSIGACWSPIEGAGGGEQMTAPPTALTASSDGGSQQQATSHHVPQGGIEIRGVVRAEGELVAGARVVLIQKAPDQFESVPSGLFYGGSEYGWTTTTYIDGSYSFQTKYPNLVYYIRADSPGYAATTIGPVDASRAASVVDIDFDLGGSIQGVITIKARPPECRVELFRNEPPAFGVHNLDRFYAPLGAGGEFRFEHVAAGPWLVRLRFQDDGLEPMGETPRARVHLPTLVHVTEGESSYCKVTIGAPVFLLDGQVTLNGVPWNAENAILRTVGDTSLPLDGTTIDREGRFQLNVRERGNYRLIIYGSGSREDQPWQATAVVDISKPNNRFVVDLEWNRGDPFVVRFDF